MVNAYGWPAVRRMACAWLSRDSDQQLLWSRTVAGNTAANGSRGRVWGSGKAMWEGSMVAKRDAGPDCRPCVGALAGVKYCQNVSCAVVAAVPRACRFRNA